MYVSPGCVLSASKNIKYLAIFSGKTRQFEPACSLPCDCLVLTVVELGEDGDEPTGGTVIPLCIKMEGAAVADAFPMLSCSP